MRERRGGRLVFVSQAPPNERACTQGRQERYVRHLYGRVEFCADQPKRLLEHAHAITEGVTLLQNVFARFQSPPLVLHHVNLAVTRPPLQDGRLPRRFVT
ncbi:MAG TPA: hypothetical protein VM580_33100 [Labilithrix sp.]|jgi:hypothetical protein|nr:hypothetical protein [Labilithrix sp.]